MSIALLKLCLALSILIFILPDRVKGHWSFLIQLILSAITFIPASKILFGNAELSDSLFLTMGGREIHLITDGLTAFFIAVVNITLITGGLYAKGYLQPYISTKNSAEMSLHYFCFLWLHASMLMVCMLRDGLAFLVFWELMAVCSFVLVIFESEKKGVLKIGLNYLIQMHIAMVFIMVAFIVASGRTGGAFNFDTLNDYFIRYSPLPLFIIFFLGFGIKAGFIPLHSWLPHAHPAAPAHVSAVMSGVMIKMGIYGILRVLFYIHSGLFHIGIFILSVSVVSGLLGVMIAIVQHDIKKLLAYHSIENIGIIGIGIGLGVIGMAINLPVLALLGFVGGLLHVLNHSLFKSLLFYAAGSVNQQVHSRQVESMGGLIKKMPWTAFFFLIGALSICGLPPFNGFVSEFLIYSGIFKNLHGSGFGVDLGLLLTFVALVIIGGLAIFCFTKVFSIVFLGSPRSGIVDEAREVQSGMLLPKAIATLLIISIGFMPGFFIHPFFKVTSLYTSGFVPMREIDHSISMISIGSFLFVALVLLFLAVRRIQQKRARVSRGPAWGCGYTGGDAGLHQYTATSYAENYVDIVRPIVNVRNEYRLMTEEEIFPGNRSFVSHSTDVLEENLINRPVRRIIYGMEKAAVFQSGKLQHYVLYALIFMALIFVLTFLKYIK